MNTTTTTEISVAATTALGEGWTEATDRAYEIALACAKGEYQRNLIGGCESLSGSTLRGKAARYGAHYARSRSNLLARIAAAGVRVSERRGERGRRVLVLSTVA